MPACSLSPIDAGLIGFIAGVAFASVFFSFVFFLYVRNLRGPQ